LTKPPKYAKIIFIETGGFNIVREGANVPFPRIKFFENANDLNANDAYLRSFGATAGRRIDFNIENKQKRCLSGYQRATLNNPPKL